MSYGFHNPLSDKTPSKRPVTLTEFQQMFNGIYSEKNERDYRTNADLVLRLLENGALIMELARKDDRVNFHHQLAHVFSWYAALANRMEINLHGSLWYKYPGVCSYCMKEVGCMCGVEHPEIENKEALLEKLRAERNNREPDTLEDHRALHERLYGRQNERIFLIQTAAHLVEEMGEVSVALRHNERLDFKNEMADVGSWIFAIATRLGFVPFDDFIWEVYPFECPACHQEKCACEGML